MKKQFKVWVECEDTIEANNLEEAIEEFSKRTLDIEFNGVEIKNE
ncbi:MAG: hypothetical protein PHS54_02865 [Clostridia bacterium]|nr:hypothetical protein [Clostridia bacterium]